MSFVSSDLQDNVVRVLGLEDRGRALVVPHRESLNLRQGRLSVLRGGAAPAAAAAAAAADAL
eukprot:CAMPEP_0204205614 /NCGR_PEP_ID=MMETSP0361-20130328/70458_1 /ASSEMBLY_ACC=CAM_ASM_000343 /TAXON_ID=268821 /ORGANISM="Scrippsiella Hangoei, Strain SHTV-5" /LENGTH=61 /DNA_ID=CAMNT_0051168895 /DNA_START=27 /DNA_END=211 /DNA_ORIENTATION=+